MIHFFTMDIQIYHWHYREWRFLAFLGLSLAAIGFYLAGGTDRLEQSGSNWRRIDIERVQQMVESGELSGREAQWFHPALPQEHTGVPLRRDPDRGD